MSRYLFSILIFFVHVLKEMIEGNYFLKIQTTPSVVLNSSKQKIGRIDTVNVFDTLQSANQIIVEDNV